MPLEALGSERSVRKTAGMAPVTIRLAFGTVTIGNQPQRSRSTMSRLSISGKVVQRFRSWILGRSKSGNGSMVRRAGIDPFDTLHFLHWPLVNCLNAPTQGCPSR
jgi:hypothetical protein